MKNQINIKNFLAGRVSKQDVADFVLTKLVEQGKGSFKIVDFDNDEDVRCLYRSEDGCKCAIGHLIPDHQYRKDMDSPNGASDGYGIIDLINDFYGAYSVEVEAKSFLRSLQSAHDNACHCEYGFLFALKKDMQMIYINHNLDTSVLSKLFNSNSVK